MFNTHKSSVSRVSRDGSKAILRSEGKYYVFSKKTNEISTPHMELKTLVSSGDWRRPTLDDDEIYLPMDEAETFVQETADEPANEVYDFNDEYDFYAVPFGDSKDQATDVYALDPEDEETLYHWDNGEFKDVSNDQFDSQDLTQWVLIDPDTAQYIANWKDHKSDEEESCSLFGNDPEEKAMFDSAEADIDWEFLDALSAVIADASGYSPVERSRNAQKQRRGPGGRFARTPGKPSKPEPANDEVRAEKELKTWIPAQREIILLPNPLNFIVDFLGAASPSGGPSIGGGVAVAAAGDIVPEISEEAQKATREETVESPDTVYFAIVDKDDNRAVMDLVAITKSESGIPQAWNRNNGEWMLSPEALADLQSVTPPPVVRLDENTVKIVMDGIDKFDKEGVKEKPVQASAFDSYVRKGYALADGSFLIRDINDLFSAVKVAPENASFDIKTHIVKRARALNRIDVVPEEWRALATVTDAPLYNSYGEVIVAAGKGRRGNEEDLKRYWTSGVGGTAKIRWGTPGDFRRCMRHLKKFIPGREAGFCQNVHQRKFGQSNYKRDNG